MRGVLVVCVLRGFLVVEMFVEVIDVRGFRDGLIDCAVV